LVDKYHAVVGSQGVLESAVDLLLQRFKLGVFVKEAIPFSERGCVLGG
jgi:hypothetical protein